MDKPYQQGSLSSFCGVYSIVNAYQYLYDADEESCQFLYNDITHYLSKKRSLSHVLRDGLMFNQMLKIVQEVSSIYSLDVVIPWRSYPNPSTRLFWKSLQESLKDGGRGCVIINISGRQEHWSVGISATDRTLTLRDSGGWKFLKYNMCTTTYLQDDKYVLYPAQTFFVSKADKERPSPV